MAGRGMQSYYDNLPERSEPEEPYYDGVLVDGSPTVSPLKLTHGMRCGALSSYGSSSSAGRRTKRPRRTRQPPAAQQPKVYDLPSTAEDSAPSDTMITTVNMTCDLKGRAPPTQLSSSSRSSRSSSRRLLLSSPSDDPPAERGHTQTPL
mmetsp:Transcript_21653/g.64607  ORF Transcript_21653/g.64607 Transcript_21653/m.64607 type:complete len:149 (-) Transcript_21653:553-999(-)